ncbi:MAG TPA: lytic transglycosylase domain-containing protein [Polyangiales bacterium]|nr:lytic transglycosylase domain-containing protein [Polyangiales bacterium]
MALAVVLSASSGAEQAAAQARPRRSRVGHVRTGLSGDELLARHALHDRWLVEAAKAFQLPLALLRAVARVESSLNVEARSRKGAIGLMQLMPSTATRMGIGDPTNARQNVMAGARYLRVLANRWRGDLVLTIASYNAGPAAVERYNGVPPYRETRAYVARVLRHYEAYRAGRVLRRR